MKLHFSLRWNTLRVVGVTINIAQTKCIWCIQHGLLWKRLSHSDKMTFIVHWNVYKSFFKEIVWLHFNYIIIKVCVCVSVWACVSEFGKENKLKSHLLQIYSLPKVNNNIANNTHQLTCIIMLGFNLFNCIDATHFCKYLLVVKKFHNFKRETLTKT